MEAVSDSTLLTDSQTPCLDASQGHSTRIERGEGSTDARRKLSFSFHDLCSYAFDGTKNSRRTVYSLYKATFFAALPIPLTLYSVHSFPIRIGLRMDVCVPSSTLHFYHQGVRSHTGLDQTFERPTFLAYIPPVPRNQRKVLLAL